MWIPNDVPEQTNKEEMREAYEKGSKVALEVLKHAKDIIKPGKKALDYAEEIESLIISSEMKLGFPVNISVDNIAAHYTPTINDELVFNDKMVVKVDIGISSQGYIIDFAFTADLSGKHDKLLLAAAQALKNGVAKIKKDTNTSEIGEIIERTISDNGFKPIANLTGHMLKKNNLHAGISIPNVKSPKGYKMQKDDVFAIEPFATTGRGYVEELDQIEIFSVGTPTTPRLRHVREVLEYLKKEHPYLPFSERSLHKKFNSRLIVSTAIRELLLNGTLVPYPVLADNGVVSQFETTVIVDDDGCTEIVPVEKIIS